MATSRSPVNPAEEFVRKVLAESFAEVKFPGLRLPRIVYHYMNATGMAGILSTSELWTTPAAYQNDSSECLIGFRLFIIAIN